jgi:hypothetical protein
MFQQTATIRQHFCPILMTTQAGLRSDRGASPPEEQSDFICLPRRPASAQAKETLLFLM